VLLTVAKITTLNEVLELARTETAVGVAELEGPQEIGGLLEVGANSEDLVDEILNTDDAVLAEVLLDDGVVGEGDALAVDLAVAALVDELTDALEVGIAIGNPRLDDLDHLSGSLGHLDEDTIVDLTETQELKDLARLRRDLVDTMKMSAAVLRKSQNSDCLPLDADNEDKLSLSRDVERALLFGDPGKADFLALLLTVLLHVFLSTLEDDLALLLVGL